MDFASDTSFDIAATSPRAEARAPVVSAADRDEFAAHLEAARNERPEGLDDCAADTATKNEHPAEQTLSAEQNPTPTPPPPPQTTPAPIVVQLIAQENPPPVQGEAKSAHVTATTPTDAGPVTPQPQTSAPPTAGAVTNDAADATATQEAPVAPPQAAARPEASKSETPAPQTTPQQTSAAPNQALPQTSQMSQAAPVTTQTQQTATVQAIAEALAAVQTTQTTAAAPAPTIQPKQPQSSETHAKHGATEGAQVTNALKGDSAQAEAAPTQAAPQAGAQKSEAKNTPVAAATKDAAAPLPTPAPASDTAAPAPQTIGTSSTAAAQAQHAAADRDTTRAASAASQVGREIIRRFDGGNARFELRLDPPELGRVEIRLEVTRDNRVSAVVAADSAQALTELARHARELEQTLQSAGLELTENGLSFDLRQGEQGAGETGDAQTRSNASGDRAAEENAAHEPPPRARPIGLERWRGVRVDVMA